MSNDSNNKPKRTDDDRRLHPYCQECKNQCERDGRDWDTLIKGCNGIYSDPDFKELSIATRLYDQKTKQYFQVSEEDVREIYDPSYWIWKYTGFTPYWYQDRALRCTSIRKALRWGRRCLVEGTPVLMGDGSWKPIEQVKFGELVATRNKKAQLVKKSVILEHNDGLRQVYRITLSNNMYLDCTSDHPLLTMETGHQKGARRVFKSIDNGLKIGDRVFTMAGYDHWGAIDNPEIGKLFGYLLTDGYIVGGNQTPKFTNNNQQMIDEVRDLSKRLFGYDCTVRTKGNGYDLYITDGVKGSKNKLVELLDKHALLGLKSQQKNVPNDFWNWNKNTVMVFINRLFAGDGCVFVGKQNGKRIPCELALVSTSKDFLENIRLTLYKCDILSRIDVEERITNKSNGQLSTLYRLRISDSLSIEEFFKNVGPIFGKEDKSREMIAALQIKGQKGRRVRRGLHCSHYKIKSIQEVGIKHTYCIGVETTHNFVANGIITMNTGKTHMPIAAAIIQRCLTTDDYKVLIVTPMKSQAKEIVTRMEDFLRTNTDLQRELVSSVQQPYYQFVFRNGSRVRIFISGTTAGSSAATQVRGQEADWLILDEMDYMHDDATEAILPILTDPERHGGRIQFTISSTPTGKEGTFFRLCNDPNFREFHVPSRSRPDWGPEMERESRVLAKTVQSYQHEYEADWGTKSDGVFRRMDVIRAAQPYRYHLSEGNYEEREWPELVPWAHWVYIMGVDWNGPGNGTRIAIVGFDPTRGKWIVTYREAVAVEDFALHVAIDRMVQLNRVWNCHAIYIDNGYGQMQDEYLRAIGRGAMLARSRAEQYHTQDLTFAEHLVSVDFGSYIEYTVTNIDGKQEVIKKPKKNYMVENFQRHFELDDFWFSKSDQALKQQFMGYSIARQGRHNENIYKADPEAADHDLDAVMLALFGFNQEFDPMFRQQHLVVHVDLLPRPFAPKEDVSPEPDPLFNPPEFIKHQERAKLAKERMSPKQHGARQIKTIEPAVFPGLSIARVPVQGNNVNKRIPPPAHSRSILGPRRNNGR